MKIRTFFIGRITLRSFTEIILQADYNYNNIDVAVDIKSTKTAALNTLNHNELITQGA